MLYNGYIEMLIFGSFSCSVQAGGYSVVKVESGVARCPYDPSHNSTALYVGRFQLLRLFLQTHYYLPARQGCQCRRIAIATNSIGDTFHLFSAIFNTSGVTRVGDTRGGN